MITFNIALAIFQWMFSEDNLAPQLVRKLLFLGLFVWLVNNWALRTNALMNTMMMLGMKAANTPVNAAFLKSGESRHCQMRTQSWGRVYGGRSHGPMLATSDK